MGLTLDKNGWADTKVVLEKLGVTEKELKDMVATNDKKRFGFNEDFTKIRANQGHSIDVDLELKKKVPPVKLYHGTSDKVSKLIEKKGLLKMNRQHVHLSADIETAQKVGKRHGGNLVVYEVDCKAALADGMEFFQSENGVWLVDAVPYKYIVRWSLPI